MLDNLIGGRWRTPLAGAYLKLRHEADVDCHFCTHVARSDADDVAEALTAAQAAAAGWVALGRRNRAMILADMPALIRDGQLDYWLEDCSARLARDSVAECLSVDGQRTRLLDAVETALARLQMPTGQGSHTRHNIPVARLALAATSHPTFGLTHLLHALSAGQTVACAILYSSQRPTDAWSPVLLCAAAACLPPGVINLVMGLGLEVGIPLAAARSTEGTTALRPAAFDRMMPDRL